MKRIVKRIIFWFYSMMNLPSLYINHVSVGKNFKVRGLLFVKTNIKNNHSIFIGDNVTINSNRSSDPIGGDCKTILCTRGLNAHIIISDNVGISNTAIVAETEIRIGESTIIGGGTKIYDTDFHSINPDERIGLNFGIKSSPIHIGSKVFIGGHSIILKGVVIGDGAVIGAGSVVAKNVPAYEVWAGNPAKYLYKIEHM